MRADHRDLAADVFFQQLLRRQQVEVEVLLKQLHRLAACRAQQGGFGAHLRCHLAQGKSGEAGGKIHLATLLDQRQIVVIDRHRNGFAVAGGGGDVPGRVGGMGEGGGQQAGGKQGFHGSLLCAAGNDSMSASAVSWRPTTYPRRNP
jgi:hypothetical protein